MDYQRYISSGVLELYVLEALSPAEMLEVERAALADPQVAEEIRVIRETLAKLAEEGEEMPRPELRSRTLAAMAAAGDEPAERAATEAGTGRKRWRPLWTWRRSAGIGWGFAAVGSAAALYFLALWNGAVDEVEWLRSQNNTLVQTLGEASRNTATTRLAVELFEDAHNHVVALHGTAHAPGAHPVVYWNDRTGEVHVAPSSMPEPPAGHRFDLWAVHKGQRTHAGSFTAGSNTPRLQRLGRIALVDSFAVTLGTPNSTTPIESLPVLAVGSFR